MEEYRIFLREQGFNDEQIIIMTQLREMYLKEYEDGNGFKMDFYRLTAKRIIFSSGLWQAHPKNKTDILNWNNTDTDDFIINFI